jgi:hypothetical protein
MAKRSIVDVGKYLQKYGLNIGEHPAFGGVGAGHSPTGYHPIGAAIDVRDWRPDVAPAYEGGKPIPWKQRTGELAWRGKQLGLFNEVLGPGDKGHDTHVHLALEGNKFITDPQLEWLVTGRTRNADGSLTDVMPGAQNPAVPASTPQASQTKDDTTLQQLENKMMLQMLAQNRNKGPTLTQQFLEEYMQANPYASDPYVAAGLTV